MNLLKRYPFTFAAMAVGYLLICAAIWWVTR